MHTVGQVVALARDASMSTSYKPALLKALVRIVRGTDSFTDPTSNSRRRILAPLLGANRRFSATTGAEFIDGADLAPLRFTARSPLSKGARCAGWIGASIDLSDLERAVVLGPRSHTRSRLMAMSERGGCSLSNFGRFLPLTNSRRPVAYRRGGWLEALPRRWVGALRGRELVGCGDLEVFGTSLLPVGTSRRSGSSTIFRRRAGDLFCSFVTMCLWSPC
jgi:hypothetical protein